ncbi:MAG: hypothetical protein ACYCOO_09005 [Chitinophagaceae bacterium]
MIPVYGSTTDQESMGGRSGPVMPFQFRSKEKFLMVSIKKAGKTLGIFVGKVAGKSDYQKNGRPRQKEIPELGSSGRCKNKQVRKISDSPKQANKG